MTCITRHLRSLACLLLLCASMSHLQAQAPAEKPKPDQLNIIKVNVFQFVVNEARLLYEMQLRKTTSLEFGLGYIYPNKFLYERAGATMLSSGGAAYVSFRKYFDKKRYIYQPFFRSYSSLMLFTKINSFKDEWLLFGSGTSDISYECELFSQRMQQYGMALRFGFQSRAGRLVLDMYSGIGLKVVPSVTTSHAVNDCTQVCGFVPGITQTREIVSRNTEVEVVINAGVQVGIRGNNRDKKYKEAKREDDPEIPDTPPKF